MWQNALMTLTSGRAPGAVLHAQLDAYARRVPILYLMLMVNMAALAATHVGVAPPSVTLYIPALIVALMAVRLLTWRRRRKIKTTEQEARRAIQRTSILGCLLAIGILYWALTLYSYGGAPGLPVSSTQAHVVLFIGLTVFGCTFLMMPVRAMALAIALIVVPIFSGYLIYRGSMLEVAIAINLLLVSGAMVYVVIVYASDFEHLVVAQKDLFNLNEANAALELTDPVTGLPNRRSFFTLLDQADTAKQPYAVAVLDLDGFRQINDLHGHAGGDDVLAEVGRRLMRQVPAGSCIARMGGDKFAFLVHESDASEVMAIVQDLIDACRAPIRLKHGEAHIGASVGISMATGQADSSISHYERAGYALDHAKKVGRGRAEIFTPDHERSTRDSSVVEQALRRADLEQEIELFYQPIVRAKDERVVSFEALARWTSPGLGAIPPAVFIPVAESNELIHQLTRVIIHKALAEAATWPHHIQVKINLSVRDLTSSEQMLHLLTILRRAPIEPRRITFEITESVLAEDVENVSAAIGSLRALGATVAIDDFGVGYSNLSYVQRLSPDLIKIDKSFVDRLTIDRGTVGIVRTILELCRTVGASSVAEGVETKAQADILRSVGCSEFQGYYFSKPLPREVARDLANAQGDAASLQAAAG